MVSALGVALLAAAACRSTGPVLAPQPTEALVDSVRYSALAPVRDGPDIVVSVRLTNLGATPKRLIVADGCTVQLILTHKRGRHDPWVRAWDSGAQKVLCTMAGLVIKLGPGETHDVRYRYAVAEILGDSLRSGDYRASVALYGFTTVGPLSAGQVAIGPR